jgi:hypothetical protein
MGLAQRLCVSLLVGTLLTVFWSTSGSALASSQVPFRASITSQGTPVTQNCPSLCFASAGTGTAAHLGRFTSTGPIVATGVTFPAPGEIQLSTVEHFVWTAANGDTVFVTNYATGVEDLAIMTGSYTSHWSITGGTGRFDGATGSGTASGTLQAGNGSTLTIVSTFVGTVSSPGRLR